MIRVGKKIDKDEYITYWRDNDRVFIRLVPKDVVQYEKDMQFMDKMFQWISTFAFTEEEWNDY